MLKYNIRVKLIRLAELKYNAHVQLIGFPEIQHLKINWIWQNLKIGCYFNLILSRWTLPEIQQNKIEQNLKPSTNATLSAVYHGKACVYFIIPSLSSPCCHYPHHPGLIVGRMPDMRDTTSPHLPLSHPHPSGPILRLPTTLHQHTDTHILSICNEHKSMNGQGHEGLFKK